jgi:hypothetical protein
MTKYLLMIPGAAALVYFLYAAASELASAVSGTVNTVNSLFGG